MGESLPREEGGGESSPKRGDWGDGESKFEIPGKGDRHPEEPYTCGFVCILKHPRVHVHVCAFLWTEMKETQSREEKEKEFEEASESG